MVFLSHSSIFRWTLVFVQITSEMRAFAFRFGESPTGLAETWDNRAGPNGVRTRKKNSQKAIRIQNNWVRRQQGSERRKTASKLSELLEAVKEDLLSNF